MIPPKKNLPPLGDSEQRIGFVESRVNYLPIIIIFIVVIAALILIVKANGNEKN